MQHNLSHVLMADKPELAEPSSGSLDFQLRLQRLVVVVLSRRKLFVVCVQRNRLWERGGDASNMLAHMKRHHADRDLAQPGAAATTPRQQPDLHEAFKMKLGLKSERAKAITNAIGVFMALDMRPFSVVENHGFKRLLNVRTEPKFEPNRNLKTES